MAREDGIENRRGFCKRFGYVRFDTCAGGETAVGIGPFGGRGGQTARQFVSLSHGKSGLKLAEAFVEFHPESHRIGERDFALLCTLSSSVTRCSSRTSLPVP